MDIRSMIKGFLSYIKKYSRVLVVHLVLFSILVTYVVIDLIYNIMQTPYLNDFAQYYHTAQVFFGNEPLKIYDSEFMKLTYQSTVYRYFLAELVLFKFLGILDLAPAYVVFSIISLLLNIASGYFLILIIQDVSNQRMTSKFYLKVEKYMILFFLVTFHLESYGTGQISAVVLFFFSTSLYCFVKKRDLLGSFLLGILMFFKPVAIFIILFLVFTAPLKVTVKRFVFLAIPLIPDALIFILNPALLQGFLYHNFVLFRPWGLGYMNSVSFSNLLIVLLPVPIIAIFITLAGVFGGAGIVTTLKVRNDTAKLFFAFIFGFAMYNIVQSDIWLSQLVYLLPAYLLAFPFAEGKYRKWLLFASILVYTILTDMFYIPVLSVFLNPIVSVLTLLFGIVILRHWLTEKKPFELSPVASISNLQSDKTCG